MNPSPTPDPAVRYGSRYGSPACPEERGGSSLSPGPSDCPICAAPLPSTRARYCSSACKQHAYRLRQDPGAADQLATVRQDLQRRRARIAHTIYECPSCEARFVGERRCTDCNRFCRALGLGGTCLHCDEPILVADLLGTEVLP